MKVNQFDDNEVRKAFNIFHEQEENDYLEEMDILKRQRSYEDDDEICFWRSILDAGRK